MEQQTNIENKKTDFLSFVMDEDIDIENVEFRPLNKGLGFHQKEADRVFHPTQVSKVIPKNRTMAKTDIIQSDLGISNPENTQKINEISLKGRGFDAIYKEPKQVKRLRVEKKKSLAKALRKDATMASIFAAWMIDMVLVSSLVIATGLSFVWLSGLSAEELASRISGLELGVFFGAIFAIYYISYFSILDIVQSPGKAGLKIRLIKTSGEGPKINETLMRTFITMLSIPLLGLPCIIDFQGKLSDTKVIQDV